MYTLWNDYHLKLIYTSNISHSYFFCVVRTLKIYSPSKFQVQYNIINYSSPGCILDPQNLFIFQLKVYTCWPTPPYPSHLPPPGVHHSENWFDEFNFLDFMYKWNHAVFVFLCLTYFT